MNQGVPLEPLFVFLVIHLDILVSWRIDREFGASSCEGPNMSQTLEVCSFPNLF